MNVQKVNKKCKVALPSMVKTIKKNHTHSVLMTTIREDLGLRTSKIFSSQPSHPSFFSDSVYFSWVTQ